jgi:hypothetical protein
MSLPTDIIYPDPIDMNSNDPSVREKYMKDLVFKMSRTYQDTTEAINGNVRLFSPIVYGSTVEGVGTYSYQNGIYFRQGLLVDYWFAVSWVAHTGNGVLYFKLPYKVYNIPNIPFVGVLETRGLTYAGYSQTTMVCISNTMIATPFASGSGLLDVNILLPASGTIRGHLRYLGQEFA